MRFDEPPGRHEESAATAAWPYLVAAALARAGQSSILLRGVHADPRRAAAQGRAAAMTAAEVGAATMPGRLSGAAEAHATAMVAAALATLERLGDLGWRAVVGEPPRRGDDGEGSTARIAIGGDAVAERTEAFDPLAGLDPGR
jgi:hypothetical protein